MVAAILSPHLDDAVLSCWHLLAQPGAATIINVFAGVPLSRCAIPWWDQLTGATDSDQRVQERIEEDRAALALAGLEPLNLSFLDEQYRETEQPIGPIAKQIEARLAPDAHIYAPAAIGGHADHVLVRAAALELRNRGFGLSLYADLPHATLHGWPAWVTGTDAAAPPDLADRLWNRTLAETEISPAKMPREVHELDPRSHARKLQAVHTYVTQLQGLVHFGGRPLSDRETLGYEVVWKVPATTMPSPALGRNRVSPHP